MHTFLFQTIHHRYFIYSILVFSIFKIIFTCRQWKLQRNGMVCYNCPGVGEIFCLLKDFTGGERNSRESFIWLAITFIRLFATGPCWYCKSINWDETVDRQMIKFTRKWTITQTYLSNRRMRTWIGWKDRFVAFKRKRKKKKIDKCRFLHKRTI